MYFNALNDLVAFYSTRAVDSLPQLRLSPEDSLLIKGNHLEQPWFAPFFLSYDLMGGVGKRLSRGAESAVGHSAFLTNQVQGLHQQA
jgi:hypothetical protein